MHIVWRRLFINLSNKTVTNICSNISTMRSVETNRVLLSTKSCFQSNISDSLRSKFMLLAGFTKRFFINKVLLDNCCN